jgi:hypothetical protein
MTLTTSSIILPKANNNVVLKNLHKSQIGMLKSLRAYIFHKDVKGEIIDNHDKWLMQLQLEEFQCFRSSKEWFSISANPGQAFALTGGKRIPDLVADFKKGIVKRDANMFPTLKQDKQWDNWQRAVIAQARAQDLIDVLDNNFVPIGIKGGNLFSEKQKFMYAVFEQTLLSNKGKALVRQHLSNFNAQQLYRTLCVYLL